MTDAYGLALTTALPDAVAAWDGAVRALLSWEADALARFECAAALDADLAVAHAGVAVCHFLDERFAEANVAIARATDAVSGQSERERGQVQAIRLWMAGQAEEAEQAMRAQLAAFPRDVIVVQRLYYLWFWQGRFPDMLDLTTALLPRYADDPFVHGLHAFALEEAGRCDEAIRAAETAIALEPHDAWAVHALAHALYESAAFDSAITRLPPAIRPCRRAGWFRHHLFWHLALLHFARGDYERAARMSRAAFERVPSSVPGNLHDSISLLWRLELIGQSVAERWAPFTAIARDRITRTGLLFHAAHIAMALAAGRDWPTAAAHLELVRARAPKDRTGLMGEVLVPVIEGVHAFAGGDYPRALARLEPVRDRFVQLGGSRAQRDVFSDTLFEAAFRAGDAARAARFVAERVARRPDRFWLARAGG